MEPKAPTEKKRKLATACEHVDRPIKARGMCVVCYESWRRSQSTPKLATLCEHTDRPVGSKGMCQQCYDSWRYWKNPAPIREKRRLDRIANPEKYKERSQQYRKKNYTKLREYEREWGRAGYKDNPGPTIEASKAWYQENKEHKLAYDKRRRRSKREEVIYNGIRATYNLERQHVEDMFARQDNKCICGRDFGERFPVGIRRLWVIDHDHNCCISTSSCGACVRGLLCSRCNQVLGMLEEDPRLLPEYLSNYLQQYAPKEQQCRNLISALMSWQPSGKSIVPEQLMLSSPPTSQSANVAI